MPAAVETSKRKFHQLLDNLTKASAPSSTKDSPLAAPKRVRLEPHRRITTPASRLVTSLDTASATPVTTPGAPAEPNYAPWSHEAFLTRLKTFADVSRWSSKPDAVNEVAWAKRGWVCAGLNTVSCRGGCEKRVVVALRPPRKDGSGAAIEGSEDYSIEIDEELVNRYAQLITTSHEEWCLWREAGCRDDIYRIPMARPAVWRPQLAERYTSFVAILPQLPAADRLVYPKHLDQLLDLLKPDLEAPVPPTPLTTSSISTNAAATTITTANSPKPQQSHPTTTTTIPSSPTPDPRPLAFALHGWRASPDGIATCSACFRRLGLWLYTRPAAPSSDTPPLKLDLAANHRAYCPWVSGASQCAPGAHAGLAAWEVLERVVRTHARVSSSSSSLYSGAGAEGVAVEDGHGEEEEGRLGSGGAGSGDGSAEGVGLDAMANGAPALGTPRTSMDVEREDRARFARLRELTRSMSNKVKGRLGRHKAGEAVGR